MTTLHAYVTDAATSISSRFESRDGQLFVGPSVLTRAGVDSYHGEEITGWQKLGLDPKRQYRLLRSPEELKAALPRMKMRPMTSEHVALTSRDHDEAKTIGAVGSDPAYDDDTDTVSASLAVWREPFISRIKSGDQKEISMGYGFRPVMTPGVWRGQSYDGVMADIEPNHFALVPEGRVNINSDGPLAAVADSASTGGRTLADERANPLEGLIECLRAFAPDKDDDHLRAVATQLIASLNAPAVEAGAGDESEEKRHADEVRGGEKANRTLDREGRTGDEGRSCEGMAGDESAEKRREDEAAGGRKANEVEKGERREEAKVGDSAAFRRSVRAEILQEVRAVEAAKEDMRGVVGQAAMVGDSAGDMYRSGLRALGVPDVNLMSDGEAKRSFLREKGRRAEKRASVGDSARPAASSDDLKSLGFGRLLPAERF